jgi:hypothetical protein
MYASMIWDDTIPEVQLPYIFYLVLNQADGSELSLSGSVQTGYSHKTEPELI